MAGQLAIRSPFESISVISGRKESDNKRRHAMEPRFQFEGFPPTVCPEPGTARPAGKRLSY